jgi:hypothetical protein
LTDRLGRHEVGLQQPGLGELTQPRGVRDVGLPARDLPGVAGVDQHAVELVLQDRPRRLPIHAGGLHHHLLDTMAGQPVAQRQQAANRAGKLRHVLLAPATPARLAHARGHLRLVHVQRCRAFDDRLHLAPSSRSTVAQRPQGQRNLTDVLAAHSRAPGETPHARLKTGSQAPRQEDRRYGRRPHHPPLFKPWRERDSAQRTRSDSRSRADRRAGTLRTAGLSG